MTEKKKKKVDLSITNETVFNVIKIVISLLIALLITFLVLCLINDNPWSSLVTIVTGTLSKSRYLGIAIERTIPYCFAGLACGLLFKAGFFNLGAEGIYIICGFFISLVACNEVTSIAALHPVLCVLAGAITGGILMKIPAFLKAKYGANEMVLSLMLNSIYLGVCAYLVRTFLLSTTTSTVGTENYLSTVKVDYIFSEYRITIYFFIMLIVVFGLYFMLKKTKLGYQIRLTGTNPAFAEYSGINSFKLSMIVNFIAGVLCGMGSAIFLLTQTTFYIPSSSLTGVGFSGALLAMLGKNNPIGIMVSTFLIKYLEQGTTVLQYTDATVPAEIVSIVQAIMVLLISSQNFLRRFREKRLLKEGLGEDAK